MKLTHVQAGLLQGPAAEPHLPGQPAQEQLSPHWQSSPQVQPGLPQGPPPVPHAESKPTSATAERRAVSMQAQWSPQEHFPLASFAHWQAISSFLVVTVAVWFSKDMATFVTPGTFLRAASTVPVQPPQVIFFVICNVCTGILMQVFETVLLFQCAENRPHNYIGYMFHATCSGGAHVPRDFW